MTALPLNLALAHHLNNQEEAIAKAMVLAQIAQSSKFWRLSGSNLLLYILVSAFGF